MSLEDLSPEQARAYNLGKLLLETPEVRRETLRLAKKANPKLNIPEVELEERLDQERTEAISREQKLETQLMEERVARRKSERDAQIIAAGFKVEDIEAIIVREKCTYETAIKLAGMERQLAEPSSPDLQPVNAPGTPVEMRPGKDWGKLSAGDVRKKSATIAAEMINEFRGRTRRTAAR